MHVPRCGSRAKSAQKLARRGRTLTDCHPVSSRTGKAGISSFRQENSFSKQSINQNSRMQTGKARGVCTRVRRKPGVPSAVVLALPCDTNLGTSGVRPDATNLCSGH